MRFIKLIICLFNLFHSNYGVDVEDSPVFGYHFKVGVPKAERLLRQEAWRIVGGSPVNTADAVPYQAGIIVMLTTGWTSICGGSLVSATRVLTAAHCWFDGQNQAKLFTIVLGSLKIFSGGTRIDTADVTIHPSWNFLLYDIGIVRIPSVNFSNTIQVIPIPTMADVNLDFVGSTGVISGFGKTSDAQNSFSTSMSLHQTTVPIIANAVCQKSFELHIHNSYICTAGAGGKGTCDGDSGGPLAVIHNNRRILIGVVSFGPGQRCQANDPSVYTRVTAFLGWIHSQM